jgi:hypothetical protein
LSLWAICIRIIEPFKLSKSQLGQTKIRRIRPPSVSHGFSSYRVFSKKTPEFRRFFRWAGFLPPAPVILCPRERCESRSFDVSMGFKPLRKFIVGFFRSAELPVLCPVSERQVQSKGVLEFFRRDACHFKRTSQSAEGHLPVHGDNATAFALRCDFLEDGVAAALAINEETRVVAGP